MLSDERMMIMKHIILLSVLVFLIPAPVMAADAETQALLEALSDRAPAQEIMPDEKIAPARSQSVTSVSKCLDLLPKEEAAAIRISSLKPYEECQKRLLKLQETKAQTEEAAKTAKETPETYKNYVRVTGEDGGSKKAAEQTP